jgi:hypothetical protein
MERKIIPFYAFDGVIGFDEEENPVFRRTEEELEKQLAKYPEWHVVSIVSKSDEHWIIVLEKA